MSDPLEISVRVACSQRHAFTTWTERIHLWWPRDHSVSGGPCTVTMEPGVGGRLVERTEGGQEHEWGRVTVWRPPEVLAYTWHLGSGPSSATDVEVRFVPAGDDATDVRISHRGWERLGEAGAVLRTRNVVGWESLLPHFVHLVETGESA